MPQTKPSTNHRLPRAYRKHPGMVLERDPRNRSAGSLLVLRVTAEDGGHLSKSVQKLAPGLPEGEATGMSGSMGALSTGLAL